jgi:hypothetical protein
MPVILDGCAVGAWMTGSDPGALCPVVGSHLGLRISDSESKKPLNVRISTFHILTGHLSGVPDRPIARCERIVRVRARRWHRPFLEGYMNVSNNDACDRSVALEVISSQRNNAHCDREGQQNSLFAGYRHFFFSRPRRELAPNFPLSILLDYNSDHAEIRFDSRFRLTSSWLSRPPTGDGDLAHSLRIFRSRSPSP